MLGILVAPLSPMVVRLVLTSAIVAPLSPMAFVAGAADDTVVGVQDVQEPSLAG